MASSTISAEIDRLDARINHLEAKLDTRINHLEAKMDSRFDKIQADLNGFHRSLGQHDKAIEVSKSAPASFIPHDLLIDD